MCKYMGSYVYIKWSMYNLKLDLSSNKKLFKVIFSGFKSILSLSAPEYLIFFQEYCICWPLWLQYKIYSNISNYTLYYC